MKSATFHTVAEGTSDARRPSTQAQARARVDGRPRPAPSIWVPGVNRLGGYCCWAFLKLRNVYTMQEEFELATSEFREEFRAEVARNLTLTGGGMLDPERIPRRKNETRNHPGLHPGIG